MNLEFTEQAKKKLKKLPLSLQEKAEKKFHLLLDNVRHPSLRSRKMAGSDVFEGRIDYHYRFTFIVEGNDIWILTLGPHDTGLGKK